MNDPVELLITGDTYLGGGRVHSLALAGKEDTLFNDFLDEIENSNISVTNLESPLIDNAKPILKTGPNLKSPVKSSIILKNAGFNLVTLANNHIMDYGVVGLRSTFESCKKVGVKTVGAGSNQEESKKPFIKEIDGIRLAIINIAENEFGTTVDDSAGAHSLNPIQNYYTIQEVKHKVNYVFVIVHGGHENYHLPSPRMKETYRFFVDAGADAVIGHHPHCYSGYEVYNNAPIFYSLGNFLFDDGDLSISSWNVGFMVKFRIDEKKLNFTIIPYVQNAEKAGLRKLKEEEHNSFNQNIELFNGIIGDDHELKRRFNFFCDSMQNLYSSYIEPHSVSLLHALRNRNLFPSLLSKRKKRLLLNLTRCEAHRDVLQNLLK